MEENTTNKIKEEKENSILFLDELKSLFTLPIKPFNIAFFSYLIGIILFFGGGGIWISIYQAFDSPLDDGHIVAYNIATFFMAVWATGFLQLDLIQEVVNKKTLKIINTILFGLVMFLFYLTYQIESDFAFIPALLGFIISIAIWYLGNVGNDMFNENFHDGMRNEVREKYKGLGGTNG